VDPATADRILKDIDAIKKLIKEYPDAIDQLTPQQQAIVKALLEKEEKTTEKPKKNSKKKN
jgi:prefoldin subunit 5